MSPGNCFNEDEATGWMCGSVNTVMSPGNPIIITYIIYNIPYILFIYNSFVIITIILSFFNSAFLGTQKRFTM